MKKLNLFSTPENRETYNNQMHTFGRIFTWVALVLICGLPVVYSIAANVMPDWNAIGVCVPFIIAYLAIGLIEAFSYAPLLGTGGQYLSFISGNISNLKLPCAINAQSISKVKQGSEEQEIITTIAISISAIVTTVIIILGLIPLAIWQGEIVTILEPISPYVIPAIFGGLTIVLLAKFYKIAMIPFIACIIICIAGYMLGYGESLSQSTMVIIGMVVSCISTAILYKKNKI